METPSRLSTSKTIKFTGDEPSFEIFDIYLSLIGGIIVKYFPDCYNFYEEKLRRKS